MFFLVILVKLEMLLWQLTEISIFYVLFQLKFISSKDVMVMVLVLS